MSDLVVLAAQAARLLARRLRPMAKIKHVIAHR
jgi:hypothetical protein